MVSVLAIKKERALLQPVSPPLETDRRECKTRVMVFAAVTSVLLMGASLYQPGEMESAQFKRLFMSGESAYARADYGIAIHFFKLAEHTRSTPEVAYDLAKCFEKIGDAPTATYYYRLYLRRAETATDRAIVTEQIGSFLTKASAQKLALLEVEAPLAASIRVDGKVTPESPVALLLPAGQHEVRVESESGVVKKSVSVTAGAVASLRVDPQLPPLIESTSEALSTAITAPAPTNPPRSNGLRTASLIAGGIGLAALATGTVFGLLARGDAAKSQDKTVAFPEAKLAADNANSKGLAANIFWAAGGAAVIGGGLMFYFSLPEPQNK